MRILDFGKNKGKILADCETAYLKWLANHEMVLAKRNRWAARDAKFILARMAEGKVWEPIISEWVTLPTEETADVHNVEKYLGNWYGIKRQAKNRELAQMRNEEREIRRRREAEDLGTRGNLYSPFALMR
jgi:hypothetical protein